MVFASFISSDTARSPGLSVPSKGLILSRSCWYKVTISLWTVRRCSRSRTEGWLKDIIANLISPQLYERQSLLPKSRRQSKGRVSWLSLRAPPCTTPDSSASLRCWRTSQSLIKAALLALPHICSVTSITSLYGLQILTLGSPEPLRSS